MRARAAFALALAFSVAPALVAPSRALAADPPTALGVTPRIPPAPSRIPLVKGAPPPIANVVASKHADGEGGGAWTELRAAPGVHRCLADVAVGQSPKLALRVEALTLTPTGPVAFIRSEWLRLDADKNAHLEREDFFFDPRTLGMTLVERSTVALAPFGGAEIAWSPSSSGSRLVYGYRDGDAWHLILPTGDDNATVQEGKLDALTSRCGHAHVVVDARAPGGGSTAMIALEGGRKAGRPQGVLPFRVLASASRTSRDADAVLSIVVLPPVKAPDDDLDISAFASDTSGARKPRRPGR